MARHRFTVIGLAAAGLLALASPASARDRNHDRIPDRWERAHHLSLKVNEARRDEDRDGLRNRDEFRADMNPRDRDTDDDGIKDGDENAGTVRSFSGGVLTIALFNGSTLSAIVNDDTEIECDEEHAHDSAVRDDHGGRRGDDDHSGPGRAGDDDHQGRRDDDDDEDEDEARCGTAALNPGAVVEEAEVRARNGEAVFEKVELR